MIKKILVGSIAALCCLLIGLLVLFFYNSLSINKKNSILTFIPTETQFVLRIKQSSLTTNNFFGNEIIKNYFASQKIFSVWTAVDSVTSRNYKTSEVLLKNTSYICVDSLGSYLMLIDLNRKTNEHFVDQFLVNSTSLRKIEKFKEGYKAFYPKEKEPVYYFVKHNVFAVSSDPKFLLSSMQHGQTETTDKTFLDWDQQYNADLILWSKNGREQDIFEKFGIGFLLKKWENNFVQSCTLEMDVTNSSINMKGDMKVDSLNNTFAIFYSQPKDREVYFFEPDTGAYQNQYYSVQIKDTLEKFQPVSFVYSSFADSGEIQASLLVSSSPIALSLFQTISTDTAVQMIPMADENIQQIAVFDQFVSHKILPVVPFNNDSSKLFATIYNGRLFIANSTETILDYASYYPGKNFIKKKLEGSVLIYYSNNRIDSKPYLIEYSYHLKNKNTISFTSEIKMANTNK